MLSFLYLGRVKAQKHTKHALATYRHEATLGLQEGDRINAAFQQIGTQHRAPGAVYAFLSQRTPVYPIMRKPGYPGYFNAFTF